MHDVINIVLASDNNYAQHVAVVVASVLCNTKEKVNIHLLSDGISKERLELIAETARALGSTLSVYDMSSYGCFDNLFTSGHISKAAYFRLDISNILPKAVTKIISWMLICWCCRILANCGIMICKGSRWLLYLIMGLWHRSA